MTPVPELDDALELGLECGELVQLSGGHTARTVEVMEGMARALGAHRCHAAVSSVNVSLTVSADGRTISAGHQAGHLGINFTILTAVERLVRDTERYRLSAAQVRARLELARHSGSVYPPRLVCLLLGVSTAAFATLFGARWPVAILALIGGWAGASVRHALVARHQKPFVSVTSAAFISTLTVAVGAHLLDLGEPAAAPALAASTLFLVPGVPLLNGTADLLSAHYLNGLVRLAMSAVIITSAALGLAAAVSVAEVLL